MGVDGSEPNADAAAQPWRAIRLLEVRSPAHGPGDALGESEGSRSAEGAPRVRSSL